MPDHAPDTQQRLPDLSDKHPCLPQRSAEAARVMMSDLISKHPAKITQDLIAAIQAELTNDLKQGRANQSIDLYEFCIRGGKAAEQLPVAHELTPEERQSYNDLVDKVFRLWADPQAGYLGNARAQIESAEREDLALQLDIFAETIIKQGDQPWTLESLRALASGECEKLLHYFCPIRFQIKNNIFQGRCLLDLAALSPNFSPGKAKNWEYRIYLNPPDSALPQIVSHLVDQHSEIWDSFSIKYIDAATEDSKTSRGRTDRVVIYLKPVAAPAIVRSLELLSAEHPEWFSGRQLPVLTAEVAPGIALVEDTSDLLRTKYGKPSGMEIRSLLLQDLIIGLYITDEDALSSSGKKAAVLQSLINMDTEIDAAAKLIFTTLSPEEIAKRFTKLLPDSASTVHLDPENMAQNNRS